MSEVSVIVTLSDKFSPGVKTMTNTVKAFSKEIDGLGAKLKTLDNLGIDATGLLAEKKGMSAEETSKAVAKGEISGSEAATLIQGAMQMKYNGSMTDEMKTFSGLTSTLEGWKQEMQSAYGEGYNEERAYMTGNRVEKTPSGERGFWKGRRYSFSSSEKKTVG